MKTTAVANPGNLNLWLKETNGYEDGYGFKWNSTDSLGLVWEKFSQNATELFAEFAAGKKIFLHVHNLNHYVLMTGFSRGASMEDSVFFVNDPAYDVNYYTETEVVKGQASIYHSEPQLQCRSQPSTMQFK